MHAEMFVEGALEFDEAADVVSECMDAFTEMTHTLPEATGTLVLRIAVNASGNVDAVTFLTDTLVPRPWECAPLMVDDNELTVDLESEPTDPADAVRFKLKTAAASCFRSVKYPAKPSESVVTMPLLFE
jgi:hypothetical protein